VGEVAVVIAMSELDCWDVVVCAGCLCCSGGNDFSSKETIGLEG